SATTSRSPPGGRSCGASRRRRGCASGTPGWRASPAEPAAARSPVKTYVLRRLIAIVPVMLVVATVTFVLVHLPPGDPASVIAGPYATAEDVAKLRHQLGIDRPLHVQLGRWYWRLLHGDLGTSIFLRRPVVEAILDRAEPTILLTAAAVLVAVLVGVPAGIVAARRHGGVV